MNIIYATNRNYERYTKLSIETLLKFNPDANITILTEEKLSLPFPQVRPLIPENFHFDGIDQKITRESYFRIFIADTFKDMDKCVYLDSDTLICGSIEGLWNLNPKYISSAYEDEIRGEMCKFFGLPNTKTYFNSGVLCMNLKNIRASKIVQKANKLTQRSTKIKNWLHDQSILNLLYGEETLVTGYEYNTFVRTYKSKTYDIKDLVCKSKILHLLGTKNKPETKEKIFKGFSMVHDYIMNDRTNELVIDFQKINVEEDCKKEQEMFKSLKDKKNRCRKSQILMTETIQTKDEDETDDKDSNDRGFLRFIRGLFKHRNNGVRRRWKGRKNYGD